MNYFKKGDYIGLRPQLTIKDKHLFQTKIGGLLSIIIILGTLSAAFYFGREIWEKSNPLVNSATVVDPSPKELVLDKLKWDFFFGLQYNNSLYIDDEIYQVKTSMYTYTNNTFHSQDYNTEPCKSDSFYSSTYEYFKTYVFKGARCISKSQNFPIQLNKLWGQEGFNYFDISLKPCVNNTSSNIICKPQKVIDEYLRNGVFSIYTLNYYISTKDFDNPFVGAIFNDFYPVSKSTYTHAIVFFTHSDMDSDIGWLFIESDIKSAFSLDRAKLNFYINNQDDGKFFKFQYQLSNLKITTTRKYLKIQELCAQIGGISKFFLIIGMILNYIPSEFNYKEYLVNEFFDDIDIKQEDQQTHIKSLCLVQRQPTSIKTKEENVIPKKIYLPKRAKLQFKYYEIAFSCCLLSKSNRLKKLMNSFHLLKQHLSIENFLQITRNISKLRFFLLSSYENDLFDYIGNPLHDCTNLENNSKYFKMNKFVVEHNKEIENKIIFYNEETISNIKSNLNSNRILRELIDSYNSRPMPISYEDNRVVIPINKHMTPHKKLLYNETDFIITESNNNISHISFSKNDSSSAKIESFITVSEINKEAPNITN